MAIKNWRDYPVVDFANLPDPVVNDQSVYVVRDRGMSAWKAGSGEWTMIEAGNDAALNLGALAWSDKPPAAGNAGKEIIVTNFNRSRWASNGTYWYPVGGRTVLKRKNLQVITGAYPTLAEVPNAFDGFVIPDDLLLSPGAPSFEVRCQARRVGTLAATQPASLQIGTSLSPSVFGFYNATTANPSDAVVRVFGLTSQITNTGNFQTSGVSGFQDSGSMPGGTIVFSQLSGLPITISARNGATDDSESWAFHYCSLEIHLAG